MRLDDAFTGYGEFVCRGIKNGVPLAGTPRLFSGAYIR